MYVLTLWFSITRGKTEVMDIGRNCDGEAERETLEIGVMMACFHCCGTVDVLSDWLNSWAMGTAKAGATRRKNHAGKPSSLVAVGRR